MGRIWRKGQRSTLTDPAVRAGEPRSALAAIPVDSVHTGAAVVAAGRRGGGVRGKDCDLTFTNFRLQHIYLFIILF